MKNIFLTATLIFIGTISCLSQTKFDDKSSKNPLFIIKIKGQPDIYYNTQSPIIALSTIKQTTIKSMDVLKDSTATKQYGKQGENGVIIINLSDSAKIITKTTLLKNYKLNSKANKLPVFLDGVELLNTDEMLFDPAGVKSVTIEKNSTSNQQYIDIITYNGGQTQQAGYRIRGK